MASVLSHPAVPLAMFAVLGPERMSPALAVAACAASIVPDVDAVGFAAGVPYGAMFGHRGFTHSLAFASILALAVMPLARRLGASPLTAFLVIFVSAASHGFLDALTTGGLGVAFFSPFSNARFFLPWRVILVSPIGVASFFSERGLRVLRSELVWIWLPASAAALSGWIARRLAKAP